MDHTSQLLLSSTKVGYLLGKVPLFEYDRDLSLGSPDTLISAERLTDVLLELKLDIHIQIQGSKREPWSVAIGR
jgi:hypothetical protein